ncbi:MAG: DUF58 domain-containing protein [Marmoricola sp.]
MRMPAFLTVVTPSGRSLVLVAGFCYVLEAFGGWPVFQLLWVAAVLMMLCAVLVALLPLRARIEVEISPRRTVAGEGAEIVLLATTAGPVPVSAPVVDVPVGSLRYAVRLPTLRRGRVAEQRIAVADLRRGVLTIGPVLGRRSDPLGLVRWDEQWSGATELLVLPRMVPVDSLGGGTIRDQDGTPSDEVSMSDLAFHALREYVPGDDLKHVHWRSSAKTDTLQVRQYHDTRRSHTTVVVDDDEESYAHAEDFETAVSVAASLAARADADGVDVSFLCGEHAVTGRGLDGVLDACCRVELGSADPIQAVRQAMRLAPETSWLVVVTGKAVAESMAAAVRAQVPAEVQLLVVHADRGRETAVGGEGASRVLELRALEELPRAIRAVAPSAQS